MAISHPSAPTSIPDNAVDASSPVGHDKIEDANLPGSLPVLRAQHIAFSKEDEADLPARIERVWYINPYGHEIWPVANPKVLDALRRSRAVVYSVGSLYTSIVPSLVLRGVGAAISAPSVLHRVLILNAAIDRETGPRASPMTARDFIAAIARAARESQCEFGAGGEAELRRCVSHLVYMGKDGPPVVDEVELSGLGIVCVRVQGRREGDGSKGRRMWRYDEERLREALEMIIDS